VRRHAPLAPSSLTSLVDILFVLVFAALVQRAAVGKPEAPPASAPRPPVWQPPPQVEALRQAAISTVASELQQRPAIVARVSRLGVLTALETTTGPGLAVALPLLEPVSDPDVALGYVGERDPGRRICAVVAARLGELRAQAADAGADGAPVLAGPPSLARLLVVISVDAPMADLTVALASGLRRDVEHCLTAHQAAAVLLDGAAISKLTPAPDDPAAPAASPASSSATPAAPAAPATPAPSAPPAAPAPPAAISAPTSAPAARSSAGPGGAGEQPDHDGGER
jgi:hypothetical protein